jgi:glucosylceramidase
MNTKPRTAAAAGTAVAHISSDTLLFDARPVAAQADTAGLISDVSVFPDKTLQTIEGFGGCFNEQGWRALSVLSDGQRRDVLRRLFDPADGLGLSVCRVPVGASDYALDRYTLNETAGDFEMKHFSIERDRKHLIPYIKAALDFQPNLRLWASAWTPPTWMKDNRAFDSGAFRDDPNVYRAYALYLLKFMRAYRAEGLSVEAVAVQNEPKTLTRYPSCDWSAVQYLTFIRDYLGPLFRAEGLPDAVMLGTLNQPNLAAHALTVLADPAARRFVSLIGLQWYMLGSVGRIKAIAPGLTLWQTETDCGNWPWLPDHDPDKPRNDIAYAGFTWEKIRDWLKAGAAVYELWNLALDPLGKNIDSERPWPQNCPVTVDPASRAVRYTPMFGAFGSFAKFVPPGSKMLVTEGCFDDALAFLDPSGRIVTELYNRKAVPVVVNIRVRGAVYGAAMPPQSFAALVVDAP